MIPTFMRHIVNSKTGSFCLPWGVWFGVIVMVFLSGIAQAQSWQSIVQPIGVLLEDPPVSALTVNQRLAAADPNITPATYPFDLSTDVTRIKTSETLYFVRMYNEASGSSAVGSWIVRASELRGKTPEQIRDVLALPSLPDQFTLVEVPAGISMYTGVAGPIAGWGQGGATQSKMLGPPYVPVANYMNRQRLGDCFLCYRTLASSGNANRLAAVLDSTTPVAYSSLDKVYDNLDLLYYGPTAPKFRQALNSISGEGITGAQTAVLSNVSTFIRAVQQESHLWPFTSADSASAPEPRKHRVWASLTSGKSSFDAEHEAAALRVSGTGLQLGINKELSANLMTGLAVGGAHSRYAVDDLLTTGKVDQINFAVYGKAQYESVYLSTILVYSNASIKTTRDIQVNTLLNLQKGRFSSHAFSARLESGYRHSLGPVLLTPFVAIEPAWLWQSSFSESLSSGNTLVNLGLNYSAREAMSLPFSAGLRLKADFRIKSGWTLQPKVQAAWIHDFSTRRKISAALQLLPEKTFEVVGVSPPENQGVFSVGIKASHRRGTSVALSIDTALASRTWGYLVQGSVQIPF